MTMKYFSLLILVAAVVFASCGGGEKTDGGTGDTDTDTDSDTDADSDSDTDADTNPLGDYWEDGYCGDYASGIPASLDCGDYAWLGMKGCCDPDGKNIWCELGKLWCTDCSVGETLCGWNVDANKYDCGLTTEGAADPSGEYPFACGPQETDTDADSGTPDAG